MGKTDVVASLPALAMPAHEVLPMVMTIGTPLIWTLFTVFVLLALLGDFFVMKVNLSLGVDTQA